MLTIRGAAAIVVDERTVAAGDVHLAHGRVVEDGAALESLDAGGCVVTAGLVNAHHHLLQSAFRTLPGTRGVPMQRWLGAMAEAYRAAAVDPSLCAVAAAAGLAESLLCGVTTVADHHLTWPAGADDVAMARATAGAAERLGARLVLVRGTAGDDADRAADSLEALAAALPDGGAAGDGMLQLATGPAGVHSDGRRTFERLGEVAARLGLRRRSQANEQVDVEVARERYGARPLELLADWGWLGPDVTLAHLCGVSAAEIDRLAATGTSATHAPGCDLPMGWGVAPVRALLAAGIPVGLGTSGGGSNDAGHLLADARLALQIEPLAPLRPPGPPLTAAQVLGMATAGSAGGLGRPELGHLRPGAAADLCVWDVSGVADAGVADPVAGLLWASPGRRPRHVVVAGRVVVRDGRLVTASERELVTALHERVGR